MGASTLVLTFDNLGEAAALERGEAPELPHPSVTVALPRLLDALAARGLQATFFVEAINCALNPQAVLAIAERGHELGHHGWRHEQWAGLPAERERELLDRGLQAFASLGLSVAGFRPPGGALNQSSARLLREAGFGWCSPAADAFGRRQGLSWVPFEWELVDAFHLLARFASLRARRRGGGSRAGVVSASQLGRAWSGEIDRLAAGEGGPFRTLVLHPFLMLERDWFDCVCALLDRACARGLAVVAAGEAARALT